MTINIKEKTLALGALCILGTAAPSLASPHMFYSINASGHQEMTQEIDFAADGVHGSMSTFTTGWTPNANSVGAKYFPIFLGYHNTASGQCLEVSTIGANSNPPPDPKIWVSNNHSTAGFVAASDDYLNYHPAVRVWLKATTTHAVSGALHVAAFSSNYNSMNFYLDIDRKNLTEAACTSGQTAPIKPWVKIIGNTMTTGAYK